MASYATSVGGLGPHMLAMSEAVLRLICGHGLDPERAFDVWAAVQSFVQGHALEESAHLEAGRRTGLGEAELRARRILVLTRPGNAGAHPLAASLLSRTGGEAPDVTFERRLGYLLDGLARRFEEAPRA
jgi:hypothetical protein